jgi:hypothetical protein
MSLLADTAAMREAAFRAPENHGTPAAPATTVASPLIRKVAVYTLPADRAGETTVSQAFHLFLMWAGTSEDTDRVLWQNYVATLVCTSFPTIRAGVMQSAVFEERILSNAMVDKICQWYEDYLVVTSDDSDMEEDLRATCKTDLEATIIDLKVPRGKLVYDINMADTLSIEAIYGHISLVLFIAGKTITDANRAAITQKRPGAIERKYFNGRIVGPLQGSLRLSATAHVAIHTVFVTLTHLRRETFIQVAQFNAAHGDPVLDVVTTTTRLMRFSGMQQAVLINNFLDAHEEAFAMPFLIPAIKAYLASIKDMNAAPVEQRPYYKLIHGDSTRAFNRNDLMNLVVVAVAEARETNPTLQQYAIPANHQLIMDKYLQGLSLLADD